MNSVCIATYNGERHIEEQLRSILVQIAPEDEVIVSDDGSDDNTLAVIDDIGDSRIRVVHSHARFFKDNFLNALRHAKGEIIFLSDQDDVWLPGKYERCVKELETADLVVTNSCLTDENLNIVNPDFFSVYHSRKGIIKNICLCTYYGACMAFRRNVLEAAMPFPVSREVSHDAWLGLVAEIVGEVRFLPEPYLLYRRHNATSTCTDNVWKRSNRPLWKKIYSRLVVLYNVCKFKLNYAK